MDASQYAITLPADYDMAVLRERSAAVRPMFDDRAGLALKAYLIRDRGRSGSPVNEYGALYLWQDAGAMARFLVGGAGFERIARNFGRVPVGTWTVLATVAGPARAAAPRAASRRLSVPPADPDVDGTGLGLSAAIDRETGELAAFAGREGVHTAVLALAPASWQLLRFVLWQDEVPAAEDATERYEVLHLSAPGLAGMPDGRHW
ncbi:protein of unknown function [Actinacidiphila yanglinensis]|uniref:DUF4865 domain-containing protein n=1 Tax=Actinacidiphila yanglinensis TaxID=310779 RepID=A0A1H5U316_9ACTN|nr:DUF4865 family protein [Actinacidiphila yanglinensis]SEF68808.1 protein of unknown function [Actinacidiphila yanglinensis]